MQRSSEVGLAYWSSCLPHEYVCQDKTVFKKSCSGQIVAASKGRQVHRLSCPGTRVGIPRSSFEWQAACQRLAVL
eukprot:1873958-Rhodomonas_salina.1